MFPNPTPIDAKTLRHTFGHFTTGVVVISYLSGDNQPLVPLGMTVNSLTSLSLTPPQILFCSKPGRTLEAIEHSQSFAVNYLALQQIDLARHYAGQPSPQSSPSWTPSPQLALPWFDGSLAWLECKLSQIIPSGDHHIIIGQVLSLKTDPDAGTPLAFYRGQWGKFSGLES